MARKKRLIPIIAVILLAALLSMGFFAAVRSGYSVSAGRYLEASNGADVVILENAPVEMCHSSAVCACCKSAPVLDGTHLRK